MTRQRGHATEDGEVTPGLRSVAAAVLDHNGHPVAGVAVTFPGEDAGDVRTSAQVATAVIATAERLTHRVSGGARASR
jgi:DNA-binding IclR family transcriptional regulator